MPSDRVATRMIDPARSVDPASYRAVVHPPGVRFIEVLDQRALPHAIVTVRLADAETAARAIREMWVRGAPLIGAVGAYGLALALDDSPGDSALADAHAMLDATRPTAVNLRWALDRVRAAAARMPAPARADAAWHEADAICAGDEAMNLAIGMGGLELLRQIAQTRRGAVRVMTHCNAGALATCGWGTATAPLFLAHAEGLPVQPESDILLADTPETFAEAVVRVLEDEEFAFHLGRRSAKLVREQFGWNRVARRFAEICEQVRAPRGVQVAKEEQEIELVQT